MSLILYYHPLSSFCWKVLTALYEYEIPFEPRLINLGDPASRADLERHWPFNKFPVIEDTASKRVLPESSIIIEYLGLSSGKMSLLPRDPEQALPVRLADRFYDLQVHMPMQRIVFDRLRPAGKQDPLGVEQARATLNIAYRLVERDAASRAWAAGDSFSMADCAAAPALYYADRVQPLRSEYPHAAAYLRRLEERPSFARVLREAEPYFALFPTG
jgi:glutathione S-transferase